VSSLLAGAAVASCRLRRPRAALPPVFALVFVVVAALLERRVGLTRAPDRALVGAVFGLALPLLAYSMLSCATDQSRLETAVWEVGRHGASRRLGAAGLIAVTAVCLASLGALLAAVAVALTRRVGDAQLASDLVASAWLGLVGGASYACWFALASTFGSRGGGRVVALLVDWILGSGVTALAAPWPRGHLRNLLGTTPVLDMPQWSALAALLLLSVCYAALAVWRSPD
jgi:hypothetical protein